MLEYSKTILEKVSFDAGLFEKEFRKLKRWLLRKERTELEKWCKAKFSATHPKLISKLVTKK